MISRIGASWSRGSVIVITGIGDVITRIGHVISRIGDVITGIGQVNSFRASLLGNEEAAGRV